jgi:hypothetical protein
MRLDAGPGGRLHGIEAMPTRLALARGWSRGDNPHT